MATNTGLTVQQVNTILSYAGAKDIKRTPFKTSFVMNGGLVEVPTTTKSYPTKVIHDNGDIEYVKSQKTVLGHETLKISAPCPSWVTE